MGSPGFIDALPAVAWAMHGPVWVECDCNRGGAIDLEAPARLATDVGSFRPSTLVAVFVAVIALVCTGTDYHQFVQSARSSVS